MDAPVYYFEAQGLVRALGSLVVDQCIRGHLKGAVGTGPVFRGTHQLSAYAAISGGLLDEPAFYEPDGLCGIAAVGVRAEANFQKAEECAVLI